MLRFIFRRLLWAIPTLFIITFLVFLGIRLGTNPLFSYLRLNPRATEAQKTAYLQRNGLEGNYVQQYFRWLKNFLTFNWAPSIKGSRPVWPELKKALANTMVLGLAATAVAIPVGLTIGVIAALKPRSGFDTAATSGAFISISIPPFISAVILQVIFAITLPKWFPWLPSALKLPTAGNYPAGHQGFDLFLRIKHLVLPVTVVAIQTIAIYSRYMRSALLEVSNSDYLRTARAKGLSERRVMVRHAMRNALVPVVTYAALDIGAIIGGLIITDRIFRTNGMGDFFLTAYDNGDFPQLMPWMVLVIISVVLANLAADIMYAVLDPRIRLD